MRKSIRNFSQPWTSPAVQNPTYPFITDVGIVELGWDEEFPKPGISPNPRSSPIDEELWHADPNCQHDIHPALGGGVKCSKCPGWFCY